jgi:LPS-assembly protein
MGKGSKARRRTLTVGVASAALFVSLAVALTTAIDLSPAAYATTSDSRTNLDNKTPPKGTRVYVVASEITYDSKHKVATATGQVEITYGKYVLVATRVVYDQAKDTMTANGEVRLKEPGGNVLEADRAALQNKFRDGFAQHLRLLLTNDATVTADYATRRDGYLTIYDHVTYTRCQTCVLSDGTPLWEIRSRRTTHNEKEANLYHEDATFVFAGVPTVTLPHFSQPDPTVKRRTGLLMPSVSFHSPYGVGVTVPYFINLAPNYDLTLEPMVTSDQGVLAHAIWRHRLADGHYDIDAAGIYQLDPPAPNNGDDSDSDHWRGSIRSQGEFDINRYWTWGWDGTLTSDKTFPNHYLNDDRDTATDIAYLTGIHDRNYFSAEALYFQTLMPGEDQDLYPYALPYIRHSVTFDQPVLDGELGFDWSAYSVHRNDPLIAGDPRAPLTDINLATDQTRGTMDIHWQRQIINGFGQVITPFTRLRGDLYANENLPDPELPAVLDESETTARVMPTAGLDVRWPFIASSNFGQQILTPVAQVISSSDEEDKDEIGNEDAISLNFDMTNLFLEDRFTGLDRYEGGTRANTGLLYTYLAPNGGFLRVSAGESFHLAGENSFAPDTGLGTDTSDLVAAVALQPWDNIRFSYQTRLAEDLSNIRTQEAGVSLNFDRFSGSVYYADLDAEPSAGRPDDEQQVWGDAAWNFTGGWSLFGAMRYDLQDDQILRDAVGFAYDCDCFSFKIYYLEDYTGDADYRLGRSVMFSIDFKSLGGGQVAPNL